MFYAQVLQLFTKTILQKNLHLVNIRFFSSILFWSTLLLLLCPALPAGQSMQFTRFPHFRFRSILPLVRSAHSFQNASGGAPIGARLYLQKPPRMHNICLKLHWPIFHSILPANHTLAVTGKDNSNLEH